MRNTLTLLAVALLALTLGASAAAQSPPAPSAPPKVAIVEARTFGVIEGAKLYEIYCASCHGQDGKGNGPAARALPRGPLSSPAVPGASSHLAGNPS
jgi:mono/diheme cytochrome c family protein